MGTFHQGRGELHGITVVVVDALSPAVWVGRCDQVVEGDVVLLDAARHQEGEGGRSNQEWLEQAARFGVWKQFARLVVPRQNVGSIIPLGKTPLRL